MNKTTKQQKKKIEKFGTATSKRNKTSVQRNYSWTMCLPDLAIALLTKMSLCILVILVIILTASNAYSYENLMALDGNALNNGLEINNGNLTVTIWNQPSNGALIYNSSTDFYGYINGGKFDVMLGEGVQPLSLAYGKVYYLDMLVNNQDLTFNGSIRKAFQSSTGNITGEYVSPQTLNNTHIQSSTLTNTEISASANIAKSKISTTNSWIESEIPDLTGTWAGSLNASRITSALLLNVNSSLLVGSLSELNINNNIASLQTNITNVNASFQSEATQIDNLNASKGGIGNCAVGTIVQNVTTTGIECVQDSTGTTSNSYSFENEYSRKYYKREVMFESVTAVYTLPWVPTAIAAGTTALIAGTYDHPGIASISSSATGSSGYSYQISGLTSFQLGPDYTTQASFKPITKAGNVTRIRFGYMDVFTNLSVVDGVFFNITQNQTNPGTFIVTGMTANNSLTAITNTNCTLLNNTWYSAEIYLTSNTTADFRIYYENGSILWNDTLTGRIPVLTGRETSHAFLAYNLGASVAALIANIDYMSLGVNRTLRR